MSALADWANWSVTKRKQRDNDAKLQETVDKIWNGSILFMLAHEFGHHILGHVDKEFLTLGEQLDGEKAADNWGADLLVRADITPTVGVFGFIYFAATDCFALKSRQARTHPADIERLSSLVTATVNSIDRLTVTGPMTRDEGKRRFAEVSVLLKAQIEESISCLKSAPLAEINGACTQLKALTDAIPTKFAAYTGPAGNLKNEWKGIILLPRTTHCKVRHLSIGIAYTCFSRDFTDRAEPAKHFSLYVEEMKKCLIGWKQLGPNPADSEPRASFRKEQGEVSILLGQSEESKEWYYLVTVEVRK